MSAESVPSAIRPARSAPSHGFRQRRTKRKQHLDAAASAPRTACDKLSNHLMNSLLLISSSRDFPRSAIVASTSSSVIGIPSFWAADLSSSASTAPLPSASNVRNVCARTFLSIPLFTACPGFLDTTSISNSRRP